MPTGHLVPAIRTLISVPAGFFAMPLSRFILLTSLGGGVWTGALALLGFSLGNAAGDIERHIGVASNIVIAALVILYVYRVAIFRHDER